MTRLARCLIPDSFHLVCSRIGRRSAGPWTVVCAPQPDRESEFSAMTHEYISVSKRNCAQTHSLRGDRGGGDQCCRATESRCRSPLLLGSVAQLLAAALATTSPRDTSCGPFHARQHWRALDGGDAEASERRVRAARCTNKSATDEPFAPSAAASEQNDGRRAALRTHTGAPAVRRHRAAWWGGQGERQWE